MQYTTKYKDRKAQVSQYVETGEVNSSLERKVKFRIPENDNRPSSRGSFRVKEPNQNHFVVPKGIESHVYVVTMRFRRALMGHTVWAIQLECTIRYAGTTIFT